MSARNPVERAGGKRYLLAVAGVVSMLALHGCVYVGGGCGSWGGGGGWHGGGRCEVSQPTRLPGLADCSTGFELARRIEPLA